MFGNLGVHVIQFPSKRFGFVGTLPVALASIRAATTADVMGGRAYINDHGALVAPHFPVFATEAEARAFAASVAVTLSN